MTKKRYLKIVMLCMCILTIVCFGGCAKVTYSIIRSDDYTIVQRINVSLDLSDIEAHNASVTEIKQDIESTVESFNTSRQTAFSVYLSKLSMTDDPYYKSLVPYIKDAVTTYFGWNGNTYTYALKFTAVIIDGMVHIPVDNVYYFYYSGEFEYNEEDDDSNNTLEDELFTKEYRQTFTTNFDSELCDSIEQEFLNEYSSYGFTLDDVAYVYSYGQKYSRLHSDADVVSYQNGVYVHTWNLEDKTQEVNFYRIYAKPVAWYVLAVAISVIVSLVLLVVAIVQKRKMR